MGSDRAGRGMMQKKLRVGILFGGRSVEHEISLLSAKSVIESLDKNKYDPVLISIDKTGKWHLCDPLHYLEDEHDPRRIRLQGEKKSTMLAVKEKRTELISLNSGQVQEALDLVFPVLHGTYGEDGTVQGLLKMANIPFVGSGVLASALVMDKDVTKRLLRDAGVPVVRFLAFTLAHRKHYSFARVSEELGIPFFIKPANAGSSVGVSKVKQESDYDQALETAFMYDNKVLVEEAIVGREIECSVLGNEDPIASLPAEIFPRHEFYSYEAKYLDPEGADFAVPALLDDVSREAVQALAIKAYQVLCCEGMARADFFLTESGKLYVNELNTIPGFTKISLYPKMWESSGLSYADLLDMLIQLAMERFNKEQKIWEERGSEQD